MIPAPRALIFALLLACAPSLRAATSSATVNFSAAIADARRVWSADSKELAELLRRMAAASDKIGRLEADIERNRQTLADLTRERAATIEEMRRGAFCTGCGRTRSDIEGRGETFPHSGQRSRPATPEELANAEKSFDHRMDPLRKAIDRWQSELKTALAELTAAHHRFLALLPAYHNHLAHEQEQRLGKWLHEKTAAETELKARHDAIAAKAKAPAGANDPADPRALLGSAATLDQQLSRRLADAKSAEERARQDERLFRKEVLASIDSLAAIARPIPDRHGVNGPFMATMIRNPPKPIGYTVNAVYIGDAAAAKAAAPASDLQQLLDGPGKSKATPKDDGAKSPAGEKSVQDLLNGK